MTGFKWKNLGTSPTVSRSELKSYIQDCHKEISQLQVESNLWTWIHEEMGCFVQINAFKEWVVRDVDHNVVAEGSSPIEAMKEAERIHRNNLQGAD